MSAKKLPSVAYLRSILTYDPKTGNLFWKKSRKGTRVGRPASKTRDIRIDGVRYMRHRIIWKIQTGKDPGRSLIDHKNGDRKDTRWKNLRKANHQQNNCNRVRSTGNSTGFKGVSKIRNKFRATTKWNKRYIHIGVFDTPEQASRAYHRTVSKIHGDFYKVTV